MRKIGTGHPWLVLPALLLAGACSDDGGGDVDGAPENDGAPAIDAAPGIDAPGIDAQPGGRP